MSPKHCLRRRRVVGPKPPTSANTPFYYGADASTKLWTTNAPTSGVDTLPPTVQSQSTLSHSVNQTYASSSTSSQPSPHRSMAAHVTIPTLKATGSMHDVVRNLFSERLSTWGTAPFPVKRFCDQRSQVSKARQPYI
jgi:hypothetical protein